MARVVPQAAIEAALRHQPEILEHCYRIAQEVARVATLIAVTEVRGPGGSRYNHGRGPSGVLAADINADHTPYGGRARSHAEWSAAAEGGTGIYGPRHTPVVAPTKPGGKKFMVFYIRDTKWVVRSHKGRKATHFMQRAGEAVAAQSTRLDYVHYPEWRPSRL